MQRASAGEVVGKGHGNVHSARRSGFDGRPGVANAVLFLAFDPAKSITGNVIHGDGGTAAVLGMLRWPVDGDVTLPVPSGGTMTPLLGPNSALSAMAGRRVSIS